LPTRTNASAVPQEHMILVQEASAKLGKIDVQGAEHQIKVCGVQ
jgi:hypothetical protein